jgi:hypothetical protein
MATHIITVTVDCKDAARLAEFWAAVLHYEVTETGNSTDGLPFVQIGPRDGAAWCPVLFEEVPEASRTDGKNKLHLDIAAEPGRHAAEIERIVGLGAQRADVGQRGDEPWTVLADPEGNEFCLMNRDRPSPVAG